jgi:hypothetical protein
MLLPTPRAPAIIRRLQYDNRQTGLLTLSQAAAVAALLHQKLLTGSERSNQAVCRSRLCLCSP